MLRREAPKHLSVVPEIPRGEFILSEAEGPLGMTWRDSFNRLCDSHTLTGLLRNHNNLVYSPLYSDSAFSALSAANRLPVRRE